ncbi:MAG: hypothetical protein HY744_17855 [Deltaproteobacteria bacterium]|nr:hypothetical protein [Deltaproteobacteria bacterium]
MLVRSALVLGALVLLSACGGTTIVDADAGAGGAGGGSSSSGSSSGSSSSTSSSGSSSSASSTSSSSSSSGGFGACDGPGQCTLAAPGCCGPPCGTPSLPDFAPINQSQTQAFFNATCPDPEHTPCPGCPSGQYPDLFAYCDGGQCLGADMRVSPMNSCQGPQDCRLRWGLGCCECNSEQLGLTAIPVAIEPELAAMVCQPGQGCPECMPSYPPGAFAFCQGGRCVAAWGEDDK